MKRCHELKQIICGGVCPATVNPLHWTKCIASIVSRQGPILCGTRQAHHVSWAISGAYVCKQGNPSFHLAHISVKQKSPGRLPQGFRSLILCRNSQADCSPTIKLTDNYHNKTSETITTFVIITNSGHLWHDKEYGHQFPWPLCHHKNVMMAKAMSISTSSPSQLIYPLSCTKWSQIFAA